MVHVLHRNESEGTGRNISLTQIQSQIDVLNEDFRRLNADRINTPVAFQSVAADYGFEFRLACQDPNGNPTNGVIRKYTNKFNFDFLLDQYGNIDEAGMGIKMSNISGSDPWPTDRYLNIWVCDFNGFPAGYSTWPADYAAYPNLDGIVIEYSAFGRTGNVAAPLHLGRIATHEVGHWLNLYHIWGDATCGDDFVADTPPQEKANFADVNNSCPPFPHLSNCPGNGPNGDMFMNYMDYTVDACKNIFTDGQRLRGRAMFATGGPRAAFLDNYFMIQQPGGTINCLGRISLTNPNCLPPTWQVVSGPASISSGQGTNQVILQASGNGNVVLRATAGNYISEVTISVLIAPPSPPTITTFEYDPCGTYVGAGTDAALGAIRYIWNLDYVDYETATEGLYLEQGVEPYPYFHLNAGQHFLRLKVENPCGISGYSSSRIFTTQDCGGGMMVLSVSPNPSGGTVEATLSEKGDKTKKKDILEIRIIDKMGNIKQKYKYDAGVKNALFDVRALSPDVYTIIAFDGKTWTSTKLVKN